METKFTKGEWRAVEEYDGWAVRVPDKKPGTVYVCKEINQGVDGGEADAKLIAAAPELFNKCKQIVAWLNKLADAAEERCKNNRFSTLVEANKADAKNYRATARDIETAIKKATS